MLKKEKSFSPRSIVIVGNIINCILAKYRKISTISNFGYSAYFVFEAYLVFIMPQRVTFVRLQVIHHSI